jgi:dsRNA-specific ribonuclease
MDKDELKTIIQDDDVTKTDEGLVFDPFNPANKEITLNEVQSILNKYGISAKVNNIALYQRAFVHRSYTKRPAMENKEANVTIVDRPHNCLPLKTKSNERLEFIGDGVLELITKYYLYRRFPKADEGFMTEKKIALVKNEHIGKLAYEMRVNKWLMMSKNAEEKKTRSNLKKLGCLFEAFLGALFLDFNKISIKDEHGWFQNVFAMGPGFQMAQVFVEKIFEEHVDWVQLIQTNDNFKNILQVKIQKEFQITPDYIEMSREIETGYEMGVYLCIGQAIHEVKCADAEPFSKYGSFSGIREALVKKPNTGVADKKNEELKDLCRELGIKGFSNKKKEELVEMIETHKGTEKSGAIFILLGSGTHKIKKKAEQIACQRALQLLPDHP